VRDLSVTKCEHGLVLLTLDVQPTVLTGRARRYTGHEWCMRVTIRPQEDLTIRWPLFEDIYAQ
jgi:hypothetical protein